MLKDLEWRAELDEVIRRKLNNVLVAIEVSNKLSELFSKSEIAYDYSCDSEIFLIRILVDRPQLIKNVMSVVSSAVKSKVVKKQTGIERGMPVMSLTFGNHFCAMARYETVVTK